MDIQELIQNLFYGLDHLTVQGVENARILVAEANTLMQLSDEIQKIVEGGKEGDKE